VPAHILVVEDSQLVTGAFRVLLEDAGYKVSIAETVKDMLACAEVEEIDLMLLDLTLPDGNGLDALEKLTERGGRPRITLAMTGDDQPATRKRCLDAGCADVLLKPISIKELRRTIAAHLG
jgi:DNA-binding response OmpR family regulator